MDKLIEYFLFMTLFIIVNLLVHIIINKKIDKYYVIFALPIQILFFTLFYIYLTFKKDGRI